MVEGLNNTQMSMSPSTMKSHVSNILAKLGVAFRTEAVTLALDIISFPDPVLLLPQVGELQILL